MPVPGCPTAKAVFSAGVRTVNPVVIPSGLTAREACVPRTADGWFNAVVLRSNSGSTSNHPDSGSSHPKDSGQQALTSLFRATFS